jgi:hypothetical protein
MTAFALMTGDSHDVLQGLWLFLTVVLTRGVFLLLLVYGISKARIGDRWIIKEMKTGAATET